MAKCPKCRKELIQQLNLNFLNCLKCGLWFELKERGYGYP